MLIIIFKGLCLSGVIIYATVIYTKISERIAYRQFLKDLEKKEK